MAWRRRLSVYTLVCFGLLSGAAAEGSRTSAVLVITNPAMPIQEISAEDLKAIFLRTKISLKGTAHLEPVVEKSGPAHEAFLKSYLGKTDSALQIYYRSLVFSGQGSIPTTLSSDAEVISYVFKTRGAIGYVSASTDVGGLKTLRIR